MATVTGINLLTQFLADRSITTLSEVQQQVLAARLDQMITAGTFTDTQIAVVLGANPTIRASVPAGENPLTNLSGGVADAKEEVANQPDPGAELTFTLAAAHEQIHEGQTNVFTVTASKAVEEDTIVTFKLVVDKAVEEGEATTGKASETDFAENQEYEVTVTILAGQTTATFDVTALDDKVAEGNEAYTVEATVQGYEDTLSVEVTLQDKPIEFALAAASDANGGQVYEGETNVFTVTASAPVLEDTWVEFQLRAGDENAANTGSTATNMGDFVAGSFNPVRVKIEAGKTTATFRVTSTEKDGTEKAEAYSVLATVDGKELVSNVTLLDGPSPDRGQNFTLTKDIDSLPGITGSEGFTSTSGNDTILGLVTISNGSVQDGSSTLNVRDSINAGAGTDTLAVTLSGTGYNYYTEGNTSYEFNTKNYKISNVEKLEVTDSLTTKAKPEQYYNTTWVDARTGAAGLKEISVLESGSHLGVRSGNAETVSVANVQGRVVVAGDTALKTVVIDGHAKDFAGALGKKSGITNSRIDSTTNLENLTLANTTESLLVNKSAATLNLTLDNVQARKVVSGYSLKTEQTLTDVASGGNDGTLAADTVVNYVPGEWGDASIQTIGATVKLSEATEDDQVVIAKDTPFTDDSGNAKFAKDTQATRTDVTVATIDIVDTKTKTLNLKLENSNLVNLKSASVETLKVTGTGSLAGDFDNLSKLSLLDFSETSGGQNLIVDNSKMAFLGGSGNDTITLKDANGGAKSISLGAGDDTLDTSKVTDLTKLAGAKFDGGEGTDTLVLSTDVAKGIDDATKASAFKTQFTSFERLKLGQASASTEINLSHLGLTKQVAVAGAVTGETLTLSGLESGGTVEFASEEALGTTKVVLADATGTADVLNVAVNGENIGVLEAAGVESININAKANSSTLALKADAATSAQIIGKGSLELTATDATKIATVDASTLEDALTFTTTNTKGTTVTGGKGDDVLTAANQKDVLIGGAGDDTLKATTYDVTLTGGEGNDTFEVEVAGDQYQYATITDFTKDDKLKVVGITALKTAQSEDKAVGEYDPSLAFDRLLKSAMADAGVAGGDDGTTGGAAWFQYEGNTFVVVDLDNNSYTTGAYTGSWQDTDVIVKLTGLIDLSTATVDTGILSFGSIT